MPIPDSTPLTDAPFTLKALWNKFALRGELHTHNPPATVREAYNQVVGVQLKEMRETVEAIAAAKEVGIDVTEAASAAATGAIKAAGEISASVGAQVRDAVKGTISGIKVVIREPFKKEL